MTIAYYFIEPIDVLMLRGNRSFGQAGEHGEALLPPWPSVFAGAFRSALLGVDPAHLASFPTGQKLPGRLGECLGTPDEPGTFRITWVTVAKRNGKAVEAATPLPADLLRIRESGNDVLVPLEPSALPPGLQASTLLPMQALLKYRQAKPVNGWLDQRGLEAHLAGERRQRAIDEKDLFGRELRLGIAMNGHTRTAAEGALYTTEAVAFREGAGFFIGIEGAADLIPDHGMLRLGGDGRAARYQRVETDAWSPLQAPLARIRATRRFRLVLATPATFVRGWIPNGVVRENDGTFRLKTPDFTARLACAAVPRHEVVSGWDLARWRPKTAQRAVPAGSVYWFDDLDGDPDKLAAWVREGIWADEVVKPRRAEGFNLAWLGAWY